MGQCAHLKNYATLPGCQVVALAELRPQLAQQVANRYGIPNIYRSAEEMLEREQLDGLVASQPFDRHGQVIPPLYQSGLPVLTEKPLAASIAVAETMIAGLEKSTSWHMVGYHKRSDPATMWAHQEIARLRQSGELGALKYVRITMPAGDWIAGGFNDLISSNEAMPPLERDPAAPDMDEANYADYTSFVNYYIHQVNLLRHLLGESYTVTYADPSGVLLAVQSNSGITGTIEMTPYQTTIGWHETALVAFERGYVKISLPAPLASNRPGSVEVYSDPGVREPQTIMPQLPWIHAMRSQAMNFISAIKRERPPLCDAYEALEDLQVARSYIRLWKGQ